MTHVLVVTLARVGLFALLVVAGAACGGGDDPGPAPESTDPTTTRPTGPSAARSEEAQGVQLHSLYTQVDPVTELSADLTAYLDGLEAMRGGRFQEAVTTFSKALEIKGDEPKYVLARGISRVLITPSGK
ncbi:MAG TPA: hypothetical protein VFA32_20960 [Dehalococcoidia bacterium]|nr:hypothetical protein [Dehalococcoidia bacterium]